MRQIENQLWDGGPKHNYISKIFLKPWHRTRQRKNNKKYA